MNITRMVGIVVGVSLLAVACGGDDDESGAPATAPTPAPATSAPQDTAPDDTAPVDTAPDDTAPNSSAPATLAPGDAGEAPQAIISLSPSATEMLYAIGADEQVLAVDDLSNHPEAALEKMQGLSAFEPNVEAIAGLDPDLVITDGTNPDLLAQLDTLDIAHWEGPVATGFDDVYAQIEQLGAVTGRVAEAGELVAQMQSDVAAIEAEIPTPDEPLTYYHELDDTYFSVTSDTFIGAVYADVGLVNIADDAGIDSPFPQLNAEFIIDQNPDLIFLACTKYCGITAASVAERPGWDAIDAVGNGGVVEMDDDIASRWGPRVVDYLQAVVDAVAAVSEPAPVG